MSDLAEKFRCVPLFLKRIGIIGGTNDLDCVRNQFPFLPLTLGSDERASGTNRDTRRDPLQRRIIW